jgi:hypothetical protein
MENSSKTQEFVADMISACAEKVEDNNKTQVVSDIISVCVKHKYLPHNVSRDFKIRVEYGQMREGGVTGKEARQSLAEKYFTGLKNIEFILYGKRKK